MLFNKIFLRGFSMCFIRYLRFRNLVVITYVYTVIINVNGMLFTILFFFFSKALSHNISTGLLEVSISSRSFLELLGSFLKFIRFTSIVCDLTIFIVKALLSLCHLSIHPRKLHRALWTR